MTEQEIIDGILEREGGYVDRVADKGGPTNFGITIPTLSSWRRKQVGKQEIQALTRSEASAIYSDLYVRPWLWIPDARLKVLLVDWAVTSWHIAPARALQRAVGADDDGIVGPVTKRQTIHLLALPYGKEVYQSVLRERMAFYSRLALREREVVEFLRDHPRAQLHNLNGWLNRCAEFV